jgi:hypothetical protein
MALLKTQNTTISKIVSIIESFDKKEQKKLLEALEHKALMDEALRLNSTVDTSHRISMSSIVNEVNKVRKQHGYKAYSV